jgi:8-oxo-dGTP diphosphatase
MILTEDDLAFDHNKIIKTAILRLRNRIDYEPDAFNLLKDPKSFTISELKKIYETIKNKSLDLPNFRKSFLREYVATGKVTELGQTRNTKGRDAKLYKYNE